MAEGNCQLKLSAAYAALFKIWGLIMEAKKQDLRVQKTLAAINRAFEEMVCTMLPQEITVKELTERAKINRKTFYLHYT